MAGFFLEDYSSKSCLPGPEGAFLSPEAGGAGGLGAINKIYKHLERTGKERLKEWGRRPLLSFSTGRKFSFALTAQHGANPRGSRGPSAGADLGGLWDKQREGPGVNVGHRAQLAAAGPQP